METILFLAFTEPGGSLAKPALETLGAALAFGAPLTVGLIGASTNPAARQIAGCGAIRCLAVTGDEFAPSRYATDAAAAEAIARIAGAAIVIAPANSRVNRALPGVAHRLGGAIDTHVNAIGEGPSITRWYYRQRMEAVLTRIPRPWFILLDPRLPARLERRSGRATVETVTVSLPPCAPPSSVSARRSRRSRPSAPMPNCCSSPAPAGPRNRPTARRIPRSRRTDPRFPAPEPGLAGQQQIAGGFGRRRPGGAAVPDAPEPDRPDRRHAAPSERSGHLLPRRGAARGRLALHQRAPRRQSRSQLRLGARQGRRALRGRRLRGDAKVNELLG